MLSLRHVYSGYGSYSVLNDINIVIQQGESIAIIGSNGAGKSTTLKTIIGLLKPVSGEIKFRDENICRISPALIRKKGISLVPEGRRLFAGMTVRENLEMGAFLRDDNNEIRKDHEMIVAMFPILKERSGQLAGTLSGGEQQMVAIARGLMSKPELFMIDELSLGLAPFLVKELVAKIVKLREDRLTILLVEQDVNIALTLSDRAYVMEQGEIIRWGDSKLLLNDESIIKCYLGI